MALFPTHALLNISADESRFKILSDAYLIRPIRIYDNATYHLLFRSYDGPFLPLFQTKQLSDN